MNKVFLNTVRKNFVIKNFKSLAKRGGVYTLLAFLLLIFSACGENSGLGASVDTEAPVIAITYPPLEAYIRDEFVLSGTWTDDKGISKIEISVIDTLTKETRSISKTEATFNNDNTWRANVNFKTEDGTFELPDGTYQVTATAIDGAGHKNSNSRTFHIDNTPPVFIIEKPGVVKSSGYAASKYGSTFTVEGTIADDHTISEMDLRVFKCNDDGSVGEEITGDDDGEFFIEEDIATAGGSAVTYANYNDSEGTHKVRYSKLYTQDTGTQKFYCELFVSDDAHSYTDPLETSNETEGNKTSNVFLYDDVYEKYLSQKNGGLGYNANTFKSILNGTIENPEVLEDLNSLVKNTAASDLESTLHFSLNPNANPSYTVNGYDVNLSDSEATISQASGGAAVSISIAAGLDETAIMPYGREQADDKKALPSVKVWMKSYSSQNALVENALTALSTLQTEVKNIEKSDVESGSSSFKIDSQKYENTTTDSGWFLLYDYAQDSTNTEGGSTKNETFSFTLPSGKIASNTYYLVGVTGCDMDLLYFSQETTFCFEGTSNTMAANTKVTYPEKGSYNNEAGLTLTGSAVADGDQYVQTLLVKFTCDDITYSEKIKVEKDSDGKLAVAGAENVTAGEEEPVEITDGKGALTFYPNDVTDENGAVLHSSGDFLFDVSKIPEFTALKAKVSDGKAYTYYWSIISDTGSKSTVAHSFYVDTVKPVYDDTNSSVGGVKTSAAVLSNWYNSDAVTLKGLLTEAGCGIESVTYWLDKSVDEEESGTTTATKQDDGTYKFSATIGNITELGLDDEGNAKTHQLILIATDKAGNKSGKQTYSIKSDMTKPSFEAKYYTMGTIEGEISGSILTNKKNDVVIYGLISDAASGVASIEIPDASVLYTTASVPDMGFTSEWAKDAAYESYSEEKSTKITGFKATIPYGKITSGEVAAKYSDIAGNSSQSRMFEFNVDTTIPEVEYTEFVTADSSKSGTYINGKIQLSGTANDNNKLDSVKGFQYKIGSGEWETLNVNVLDSSTVYSWKTEEFDTSDFFADSKTEEVSVTFRAIVLDAAGNTSIDGSSADSGYSVIVSQNTDRPNIIVQELEEGSDIIISTQNIMGTISDDDGIAKLEYKDTNANEWQEITVSSGTWKIEGLAAGSHEITFKVTDKAGSSFETGKSTGGVFATNAEPYLAFGDGEKSDMASSLSFKVDVNAPEIKTMALASSSTTDSPDASSYSSDGTKSYGSSAKYMWIKVTAKEDVAVNTNAADDISLKIGTNTISITDSKVSRDSSDLSSLSYIIGPIDTSELSGEGTLTVSFVLKDKSGRSSDAATSNVYFDKAAPIVTITSPSVSGDGVETIGTSSDAVIGQTTIRGQISDASKITKFYYIIPTAAQKSAIDAANYTFSEGIWTDMADVVDEGGDEVNVYESKTSMIWRIPLVSSRFDQNDGLSLVYYATANEGGKLTYAEKIDGSTNVYVPLYFYAEDETGKGEIYKNMIRVDPIAGIPVVEIITPEAGSLTKTGGNLNFQGTASDDEGDLEKVVMTKLEVSADEVTESTDLSSITWKTLTSDILNETDVVTKGTVGEDGTITASGKASWKVSVVTSKIDRISTGKLAALIGTKTEDGETTVKDITIARATFIAYDKNGTASTFKVAVANDVTTLTDSESNALVSKIYIDKNAPQLTNIQLVQFDAAPATADETPVLSRSYSAGMFISKNTGNGNWYLKGTVTDDASVEGITITSDSKKYRALDGSVAKGSTATGGMIVNTTGTDAIGEKTCTFLIPLDTDTTTVEKTQFYATIELDDGQHTDVTQNLSFFVDNTAPSLYTTENNATTALTDKSTLRLKDNSGLVVGTENVVENSDGSYTFGDSIAEDGSGLAYVAVFFTKESDTKYFSSLDASKTTEGVTIGSGKTLTLNDENLPVLTKTVTRADSTKVSFSGLGSNANITVGTLVKIGGSYHLITAIADDVATLEDDVDTTFTSAEFVYAQIVNHQVTEGFASDWSVSNDDYDGFVEMVKQSGSNYKWTASIRSENIPDGPATIHIVAFDEAGNVNSGYVETSVQNNRPRISKVFLGTDLNGNGKFDYFSETSTGAVASIYDYNATGNGTEFGELSFYSALSSDGKIQGSVTLKSSNFVAKDGLLVLPEIIGGNTTATDDLKYLYKVAGTEAAATITKVGDTDTNGSSTLTDLWTELAADDVKINTTGLSALPLANKAGTAQTVTELLDANTKADKWNYYETTSDYEKGTAHGGTASGKFKGLVLNNDALSPHESWTAEQETGSVKYFAFTIWDATTGTTQGTDSLYALLKIPMVVNVIDDIGPKAEIHPFYWNSKEDGSFYYDEDGVALGHIDIPADETKENPGVSGQVWVKVTVTDETLLKTATFTDPARTAHPVATYEGGVWTKATTLTDPIEAVELLDTPEPNQAGHTMTFRVAIDMTTYGLAKGMTVDAGATDTNSNHSTASTVQTLSTALTSHYKMDFVPYIKSIYPATESSAARSRLGKFPVQAGKPMVIEGLNFAAGATYKVHFAKSKTDGTVDDEVSEEALTGNVSTDGQITVTAPQYSRWVSVTITQNSVSLETKNNTNTNGGYNIEEGYVSSDSDLGLSSANRAGTNFWTDDRYIQVWQVDTNFAGSVNPHSGVIKKISANNSGSFSTNNAGLQSGSSDTVDTVGGGYFYNQAGTNSNLKLTANQNDRYFGALSSDDIKVYGYLSSQMTNKSMSWNNVITSASEAMGYAPGIDEMDFVTVNGLPYYVMQDNYLGGDSASVWGPGLFLTREGMQFAKDKFQGSNTIEESKCFFIIERQGDSGAAAKRTTDTAKTGYDRVLYQFKNPRIAGVQVTTEKMNYSNDGGTNYVQGVDYIYVSYYDSYARCLKYAGYKVGHRIYKDALISMYQWGQNNYRTDIVPMMHSAPNEAETVNHKSDTDGNTVSATNHMTDGASTVAGYDTTVFNPTSFEEEAGEWSDVMVDTTGETPIPVIIYFKKGKTKADSGLEIARGANSFPTNNRIKTSAATTGDDTEWHKTLIKPSGTSADFGRYVSAAMDDSGNIHAAAVDAGKGKVYYLYLVKSGNSYTLESYSILGAVNACWTDIELTYGGVTTQMGTTKTGKTATKDVKPVISWVDKAELGATDGVKVSYLADDDIDGTKWETMTDPAIYAVKDQRTSVMADVYEGTDTIKAPVAVGFNSDMLALDFMRAEE